MWGEPATSTSATTSGAPVRRPGSGLLQITVPRVRNYIVAIYLIIVGVIWIIAGI